MTIDNKRNLLPGFASRELTDVLMVLWRAFNYAQDVGTGGWEFAVEIQVFYNSPSSSNELRWLIAKGFVEHGLETTICGNAQRSFEPTNSLIFSKTSAVTLTESGAVLAKMVYAAETKSRATIPVTETCLCCQCSSKPATENVPLLLEVKPTWDVNLRQLHLGDKLVKWFRVPAASQETVLSAFEEESWPAYIDDPLPHLINAVPKQRLNSVIMRLNSHQSNRLIHFHGDGRGEGIGWSLRETNRANGKSVTADYVSGH